MMRESSIAKLFVAGPAAGPLPSERYRFRPEGGPVASAAFEVLRCSILVILLFVLTGCGPSLDPLFESLLEKQPRVVAVEPADGSSVSPNTKIVVRFSRKIDPASIGFQSFAVIPLSTPETELDELTANLSKGKVKGLPGIYQPEEGFLSHQFFPESPLKEGERYAIVVTTDIKTLDGMPLNQKPGLSPTPFWSQFYISANPPSANSSPPPNDGQGGGGSAPSETPPTSPKGRTRPESVVINEVLYDISGSDTNGQLFVELFGTAGGDITDYSVAFINGENGVITDTIALPEDSVISEDGIFLIADAKTSVAEESFVVGYDLTDNFDPQNGPDCIQLTDEAGRVIDALGYGAQIIAAAENGYPCVEGIPAEDAGMNLSLSRVNGTDTNDNAADFIPLQIPTPGEL